ncbi:hypothetical protein BUALT_Bualt04G0061800 [Buddleja alternifolia]|uniref:DUF7792 domain-containing protein n=1 Tax=Buddleja alternifolia TaxID=168488 RepID=A0AAV6XTG5_9LAMI|nr:hypothetical protein BUALT_Bualt04G0061800 [Buddleja alternifolia]
MITGRGWSEPLSREKSLGILHFAQASAAAPFHQPISAHVLSVLLKMCCLPISSLSKSIHLTDQVIKAADVAAIFKQECSQLKFMTQSLAALLCQAERATNHLYESPTRRIIGVTEQVLHKALALVLKCSGHGLLRRVVTIIPTAAFFRKMSSQLENSIGDVSWLLRVSTPAVDRDHLGLPPIASNLPILCLIWEHIAILYTGSLDERSDAAASLVSLARDNDRNGKYIVEEGGVGPLLRLVREEKIEGQEIAARAIGLLGKDPENVQHMIDTGVCLVFAEILEEGPMRVQAVVAWALSELAAHYPKCQDLFAQHNIIGLLVSHLAFETMQEEHSKYAHVVRKATSMHEAVVLANTNNNNNNNNNDAGDSAVVKGNNDSVHQQSLSLSGISDRAREMEDPATKAYIKAMAARALWQLAKRNSPICRSITESRALLCFAVLLEKGAEEVQYNSVMALMEITAVAEQDADIRRSAFKPNSPVCKAVIDQLLSVIEKADSELLVPCVKAIGNLSMAFKTTETRMISPLVKLLDESEAEVTKEACIALTKFVCSDNYLHLDHSKAIIGAGGAKHLVQLVYFGEQLIVQSCALILLCNIALHVPDSEDLAGAEVLAVLKWADIQPSFWRVEDVDKLIELLPEAKEKLELYQSRRGYHKSN